VPSAGAIKSPSVNWERNCAVAPADIKALIQGLSKLGEFGVLYRELELSMV